MCGPSERANEFCESFHQIGILPVFRDLFDDCASDNDTVGVTRHFADLLRIANPKSDGNRQ